MSLLIAFYGDDFTGSTDALEFLSRAGIRTVLFIEPPTEEQLSSFNGLQAIGVAGMTRAMKPDDMEKELRFAFSALKNIGPKHVHYKVCSTFDSSPEIGSIGKAIDIGAEVFSKNVIPLLVAAPILGRHCVFGNLFARMGIGSNGAIHRLDRHPSMSKHPSTPADESDLRLHLSKQTSKKTGLIDILDIQSSVAMLQEKVKQLQDSGNEIILFDALYQEQLPGIGKVINDLADRDTLFSVGSSGIEMALTEHWKELGIADSTPNWEERQNPGPVLVASGSCSPVTSVQITHAVECGFKEVSVDTEKLAINGITEDIIERYSNEAIQYLQQGFDVIIHTSRGPEDIRVKNTDEIFRTKQISKTETAILYGTFLGRLVRIIAERSRLKRIIIAGGDTSSYAARAMGITAVEMIAPMAPGAPLCLAFAPGSAVDKLQVNFKGGQVGKEDYFLIAKD